MAFKPKTKIATLIMLAAIVPSITHAGLISFFTDFFAGPNASAEAESFISSSSQDMPLLEPAIAPNPVLKTATDIVVVGDEALLPEVGPLNEALDKIDNSAGQISVYQVRSGDTLAKIAEMFDVSVNTIIWANDLTKGSALKAGQTLVILPMTGVMHTVVSGDTLSSIAKKYSGDLKEIADFNDLKTTDKLVVGDTIIIPNGEMSFSTRPSTYVVARGATKLIAGTNLGPDYGSYYSKPFIGGTKTQGLHGYNGVDYGMPTGNEIYAAAPGTVIIAKNSGWNGGYGNYTAIKHPNNTQTVYGHLNKVVVSVGQTVTQGQLIGYSGNSGNSTGPHLHFEIRGAKNPF